MPVTVHRCTYGIGQAVARLSCCFLLGIVGCGAFNPAFVNLLDPTGTGGISTLENAPGHVAVQLVNNATVDEELLNFLESPDGGNLDLTEAERQDLRPRLRMRVRVTFTDGSFQTIEFIDGSSNLVDPRFDTQTLPDLNQNDLANAVVVCDVASVTLEPGTDIEVFVPVELTAFELVESATEGGAVERTFEPRATIPPQFRTLQTDEVDEDGNVVLRRNIGIRDVPSPTFNPLCGSVVAIVVDGVLAVPFLRGVSDAPSFDQDDPNQVESIGGRYEFRVTVR